MSSAQRGKDAMVSRPVPTLIHDGRAWVEAGHYDRHREALEDVNRFLPIIDTAKGRTAIHGIVSVALEQKGDE